MLFKRSTSKKGFTLIELMIVVAILGILLSIMIPACNGVVSKMKAEKAQIQQLEEKKLDKAGELQDL